MLLASAGIVISTMVGPLGDGQSVRISRPGGGPPEVVRQVAAVNTIANGGAVVVPSSAVAGGGAVTVIGAEARAAEEAAMAAAGAYEPRVLYTEQLLRAFGYDRSNFGYTYINWPRRWGGWGSGHRHQQPVAEIDPRVAATLRDAAPIESRFPPVPGR